MPKIDWQSFEVKNANKIVTEREKRMWSRFQMFYEGISRVKDVPFVGYLLWRLFKRFQAISPYYPFRDLSKPNFISIYVHTPIAIIVSMVLILHGTG